MRPAPWLPRRRAGGPILAAALLLSACAVGPDFVPPPPPRTTGYTQGGLPAMGGEAAQALTIGKQVSAEWWSLFRSPPLDEALRLAVADSPTLEAARAALAQARDAVAQAEGGLYPQLDLDTAASRSKQGTVRTSFRSPGIQNFYSFGPTASFSPDLFGRTGRAVEQQTALAEVQRHKLSAAYLTLTGNVVSQAIDIAAARASIQVAEEVIAIDQRNLDLVRLAFEGGKRARTDVLSAESQLAADRAALPPLHQQLNVARHALAVLVGQAPADWSAPDFDLDRLALPRELPVSLPSALVRQRPDILAAEAQLAAANAAIGVATANLYPNVTLSASWSREGQTLGALFSGPAAAWQLAASLTAPIFHGGALQAQRQAAVDAYAGQLATYRQTVLLSFQQVADVLRALQADAELIDAQGTAVAAARASLELQQESYVAGQSSLLQVLDAERLYQQARSGDVRARAQRLRDSAQFFVAMGGGAGLR